MYDEKDHLVEVNRNLIKIFDDLLATDEWQASQVLKVSAKRLQALRDEAETLLKQATSAVEEGSGDIEMMPEKKGYSAVYVLLYQTKGLSLDAWHERIMSLRTYQVSLPVYRNLKNLKKVLRHKSNPDNYGYIEALVPETMIVNSAVVLKDALGQELTRLREDAIKLDHIRWFSDGQNTWAFAPNRPLQLLDGDNAG